MRLIFGLILLVVWTAVVCAVCLGLLALGVPALVIGAGSIVGTFVGLMIASKYMGTRWSV